MVKAPTPELEFPRDVRVLVGNRTGVDFEIYWDSEPYNFANGSAETIEPEIAWAILAFETRGDSPPHRNYDTGNDERNQPSYYKARLISMGIANDPIRARAFHDLQFKVIKSKRKYSVEEFDKVK